MKQSEINIIANITSGSRGKLEVVLLQLQKEWLNKKELSFESLNTIHFCRWVILDTYVDGGIEVPDRLYFESNFDGDSKAEHIKQWCSMASDFLDKIYIHCDAYPSGGGLNESSRFEYLNEKIIPTRVFFSGAPERSLDRIRAESLLRNRLRQFLDSKNHVGRDASDVVDDLRNYVDSQPDLVWAKNQAKIPGTNWLALIIFGIVMIPLLPLVIIMVIALRIFYERKEVPLGLEPGEISLAHMNKLEENEDFCFQNQFSQIMPIKKGWLRRIAMNFSLFVTGFLGKALFDKGQLMGIPTIHFARWIVMDNNKRMLFLSNFDGSWEQYLGDFIDKSGWGLTGIYSATVGFPRSYFLFFGGAYNEEQFLAWSRYYQIPTQFWYSAYPNLSIKNIVNNSAIRHDLFKSMTDKNAQKYLQRI